MAKYEVWLLDDAGNRIIQMDGFNYLAYSRTVSGLGTCQIGLPFQDFVNKLAQYWKLDRRIEVWRAPLENMPLRRDAVFFLRSPRIYSREDGWKYIEFYGRSPIDLLKRRSIPQYAGSSYTSKTDYIDDMMKDIVRENMLYGSVVDETGTVDNDRAFPQYEFSVQADRSLGPSVSMNFADSEVYDVLIKLRDLSLQKNKESAANRRVFFDVIPYDLQNYILYIIDDNFEIVLTESGEPLLDESSVQTLAATGFQFQTLVDRFGIDRTDTMEFSEENGNFTKGAYQITHMDEINAVCVKGQGEGLSRQVETVIDQTRINASRWNRREILIESSNDTTSAFLQSAGKEKLWENVPAEELTGTFHSVPEGVNNPSSLYGLDWDLGDLVRVQYAGKYFDTEIKTIHVSIDDTGKETILGRNVVE